MTHQQEGCALEPIQLHFEAERTTYTGNNGLIPPLVDVYAETAGFEKLKLSFGSF